MCYRRKKQWGGPPVTDTDMNSDTEAEHHEQILGRLSQNHNIKSNGSSDNNKTNNLCNNYNFFIPSLGEALQPLYSARASLKKHYNTRLKATLQNLLRPIFATNTAPLWLFYHAEKNIVDFFTLRILFCTSVYLIYEWWGSDKIKTNHV